MADFLHKSTGEDSIASSSNRRPNRHCFIFILLFIVYACILILVLLFFFVIFILFVAINLYNIFLPFDVFI